MLRVELRAFLLAAAATLPCVLAFSSSVLTGLPKLCQYSPRSLQSQHATLRAQVGKSTLRAQVGTTGTDANWRQRLQESRDAAALAIKVFETGDERPIILYDGICNLCNGGVNFMLDWDSPNEERGNFRFAALQSDVGNALLQRSGRSPNDVSSIILATKDGKTYSKSDAILRIGQGLGRGTLLNPAAPIVATAASVVLPSFFRDGVYDLIANNRYNLLGKSDECRLQDDRFDERFVGDLVLKNQVVID